MTSIFGEYQLLNQACLQSCVTPAIDEFPPSGKQEEGERACGAGFPACRRQSPYGESPPLRNAIASGTPPEGG